MTINNIRNFLQDESGATAIEYGLLAALVAVAIIAAVSTLGKRLTTTFEKVTASLPDTNTKNG
ncbi:Flp family type IVb pilin [Candidatus Liberibacter solanacearum]|uniref:Pilus assembly protein n=1 Tax=Candidatus Liberibacter solanacearum TaxID=556287 RepID=A0A1V2N8U4_9HYPH|nr:Flp family type IVb pilin [Candidatus Liberibacter solanacearum]ONI59836.1 pilus assembly protein [Candidatus Liberibacter solanacearum]ONI60065.1 pilus assembly protein [Candidatus Liberibacter solanacearum]